MLVVQHCVHVNSRLDYSISKEGVVKYLDSAITGTKSRNERSPTFIRRVHAETGTGAGIARFFDAALYVSGAGAVACYVETLCCAVGCVLACS